VRVAAFLVAGLVGWLGGYAAGAWPWLGYAWLTRSSFGAGGITIVGESRRGMEFGFDDFWFFEGQEVVVDYEVKIRRGSLWFHVYQPFDGVLGGGATHYVIESGRGAWTTPITKTGFYHITVDTSPTKGPGVGWDMDYTAYWGARPASK